MPAVPISLIKLAVRHRETPAASCRAVRWKKCSFCFMNVRLAVSINSNVAMQMLHPLGPLQKSLKMINLTQVSLESIELCVFVGWQGWGENA